MVMTGLILIEESPTLREPSRASGGVRFFSSGLTHAFHYDAHPVSLDDGDRCLWRDEFAFGNNVDNVIGETRFAAWS